MTADELLTAREVAAIFRVDPKTVTRWANKGWLPRSDHTWRGWGRFRREDVDALLESMEPVTHDVSGRRVSDEPIPWRRQDRWEQGWEQVRTLWVSIAMHLCAPVFPAQRRCPRHPCWSRNRGHVFQNYT